MPKDTRTIKDLEIFAAGTWNGDPYSMEDLKDIIAAAPHVGFDPPLKLGHMEDNDNTALLKKEAMPAFGWITNLRLKGSKLIADITDIPKRLADMIDRKQYKRVSAEIFWNFKKGDNTFRRVLKAVALLGAEIPAITDLKGIETLYTRIEIPAKAYDEEGNEYRTYFYDENGGAKKWKVSVDYRLAEGTLERCGSCRFYGGNPESLAVGWCSIVEGEIASDAICNLYEEREAYMFPGGIGPVEGITATAMEEGEATTSEEFEVLEFKEDDHGVAILSGRLKETGKFAPHKVKFKKSVWAMADAKSWLRSRKMKVGELQETEAYMTFIQRPDHHFEGGFTRIIPRKKYQDEEKKKKPKDYIVEKRDGKWCLIAKGTGETLGCHDTEGEALAQERAVQANKTITLSLEDIRELCPECAEEMESAGTKEWHFILTDSEQREYVQFVVGKLKGSDKTTVQSVLFDKDKYTKSQAEAWLKSHGMRHNTSRETDTQLRFRQRPPEDFDKGTFKTVEAGGAKKSLTEGSTTTQAQSGHGVTSKMDKLQELEARVSALSIENQELKSDNARLKKEGEEARSYQQMILDQNNEIETLRGQLNSIQMAQKEEKIRSFIDGLVREGKVLPKEKVQLIAALREANEEVKVQYSEGGTEIKLSQRQLLEQNLRNRPRMVDFKERSQGAIQSGGPVLDDDEETEHMDVDNVRQKVHELTVKFQAEHNEPNYKKAQERVLAANVELKRMYAESSGWSGGN